MSKKCKMTPKELDAWTKSQMSLQFHIFGARRESNTCNLVAAKYVLEKVCRVQPSHVSISALFDGDLVNYSVIIDTTTSSRSSSVRATGKSMAEAIIRACYRALQEGDRTDEKLD